jgi:steroid delta-isomerase-like uncharacterized protein
MIVQLPVGLATYTGQSQIGKPEPSRACLLLQWWRPLAAQSKPEEVLMFFEENKDIVAHCWRACLAGDLAVTEELVAVDYVWHGPGQEIESREGIQQWIASIRAGFPDVCWEVDDQLGEGNKVATRWTARGTHNGAWLDLAPTGQAVRLSGLIISRLEGGRITEEWEQFDQLTILQQLGAVPAPGHAGAAG